MVVSAPNLALSYFFDQRFQTASINQVRDLLHLDSSYVVELKNNWISFPAVNTRVS